VCVYHILPDMVLSNMHCKIVESFGNIHFCLPQLFFRGVGKGIFFRNLLSKKQNKRKKFLEGIIEDPFDWKPIVDILQYVEILKNNVGLHDEGSTFSASDFMPKLKYLSYCYDFIPGLH